MPFYNYYYTPYPPSLDQGIFGGPLGVSGLYGGHGIFGIYGSQTDFLRDLQGRLDTPAPTTPSNLPPGARAPVTPNPVANLGESLDAIDARMARGGPSFNSATGKFDNVPDEGIEDKTGEATKGYGILPWLGVGLYGLNTLGNLFLGWRSLDLAREQFNFQRDLANQNLAASIQAYNEAQRRRLRGAGFTEEEVDRMMREQGRELKDTRKRK